MISLYNFYQAGSGMIFNQFPLYFVEIYFLKFNFIGEGEKYKGECT